MTRQRTWNRGGTEYTDNSQTVCDNRMLTHSLAATSQEASPLPLQPSGRAVRIDPHQLWCVLSILSSQGKAERLTCPKPGTSDAPRLSYAAHPQAPVPTASSRAHRASPLPLLPTFQALLNTSPGGQRPPDRKPLVHSTSSWLVFLYFHSTRKCRRHYQL